MLRSTERVVCRLAAVLILHPSSGGQLLSTNMSRRIYLINSRLRHIPLLGIHNQQGFRA